MASLKDWYYAVEDKYYDLMDSVEEKTHVYEWFVNPLEDKGVPSFPVFVLVILALIAVIAFLVSSFLVPSQTSMQLSVLSSVGPTPIPNATVSVAFGSQVLSNQTDANGNVSFQVPANTQVRVSVSANGFNPFSEEVSTSSQSITLPSAITLSFASLSTQEFLFNVVDQNGNPLSGASVVVNILSGGSALTGLTDSSGHVVFNVTENSILTYTVSLAGYVQASGSVASSSFNQTVSLAASSTVSVTQGGSQLSDGEVFVNVNDSNGNQAFGTVDVYDAVSNKLLQSDTENGSFSFNVTLGESVYVTFSGNGFVPQTSSPQTVSSENFFTLTAIQATPSTSENITASVVDQNGNPLSGVEVQLFQGGSVLESDSTDSSGSVVFTVSKSVGLNSLYLTGYLPGYLPAQITSVSLSNNLVLNQLLVGGYGSVNVNVVDAGGNPVVNGNVNFYTASGLNLGVYPVLQTDTNGNVNFQGLPVNVSLIVKASYNGAFGSSDAFTLNGGENTSVNIQLSRPLAEVTVNAVDLVSKKPLAGASVLVSTLQQNLPVENCTTNSQGVCVLNSVWADGTQLVFTSSLNGYAPYTSAPIAFNPLSSNVENINMVSNAFNNQTLVVFNGVTDLNGNTVTSLTQGGFYIFHFTASFVNSSQQESLMFRVGDQSTVSNESAYLSSFSYSPSIVQPQVVESSSYNPSGDCSQDVLSTPTNGEGKWVKITYSGLSGTAELNPIVFVNPNTAGQTVNFYYRASSVVNGIYSRDPFDTTLNYSQKTQSLDSCYANSHKLSFNVIQGSNYCNAQGTACVQLLFNGNPSPFTGLLNQPFNVSYKLSNFGPVDAQSAYVLVKSLGNNILFNSYSGDGSASIPQSGAFSAKVLLGSSSENYSGSFASVGVLPVSGSQVYFEFGDTRGAILSSKGFVSTTGNDGLNVQVSSGNFTVGTKQTLTVLVTSVSNNQPITDATVSLNELQGTVFNGNPTSPVVGDGGPGSGENGKYVFNNLITLGPGVFQVQASEPNFQPGSANLNSIQTSFFTISPSDYLPLTCNTTNMQVTNNLDIPVSLTISSSCANVSGFNVPQEPNGNYFISAVQPGKTVFLGVQPTSASSCIMTFTSSDPRSGYNYFNQLQVQNNCNTFGQVNYSGAAGVIQITNGAFNPNYDEIYATLGQQYAAQQMNNYFTTGSLYGISGYGTSPVYGAQYGNMYGVSGLGYTNNQNLLVPNSPYNFQYYQQTGINPTSNPMLSLSFNANSQMAQLPKAIAWINNDPVAYNLSCSEYNSGVTAFTNQLVQPGGTFVYNFSSYGLYSCSLSNGAVGQVQIDSVCQGMSAQWITGLWENCMARSFINNAGWFGSVTGEDPTTKKISASIDNQFTLTLGGLVLTKHSDKQSTCTQTPNGNIACIVMVSPVVPENGLAFVMNADPKTGVSKFVYNQNNPSTITVGIGPDFSHVSTPIKDTTAASSIASNCFQPCSLTESTDQCGFANTITSTLKNAPQEVFQGLGLESQPNQFPYIVRFNPSGDCLQTRIVLNKTGQPYAETMFVDPISKKVLCADGTSSSDPTGCGYNSNGLLNVAQFLSFNLNLVGAESNGNLQGTVSFIAKIDPMYDFPFLFYTVPQVGSTITFRSVNATEPVFIINNLPSLLSIDNKNNKNANISFCSGYADTSGTYNLGGSSPTPGCSSGNSQETVNESLPDSILYTTPGVINTKTKEGKTQYQLNLVFGTGVSAPNNGINVQLPSSSSSSPQANSFDTLGNVAGASNNNLYAQAPSGVSQTDFNNIAKCSGDNWCDQKDLQAAETSIKNIVNAEMKKQVDYIERYDAEGFMNNMGDALTSCLTDVLNAMVANWAQMQMCNVMAQFCGTQTLGVPSQYMTVQQGESMGWGNALNPSNLLSQFSGVLSDVFCHETQLGANIQYLSSLTQTPQGRAYLTDLLMKHLASNSQQVKTVLSPVTPEPTPVFSFILKGAADGVTNSTHPGFNLYAYAYNPQTALQNNNYQATFISFGSGGWFLPAAEGTIQNIAGVPTATLGFVFETIPSAIYTAATAKNPIYPNASLKSGAMPYLACSTTSPVQCTVNYTQSDTDVNLYTVNKYQFQTGSVCPTNAITSGGVDCSKLLIVSPQQSKTQSNPTQTTDTTNAAQMPGGNLENTLSSLGATSTQNKVTIPPSIILSKANGYTLTVNPSSSNTALTIKGNQNCLPGTLNFILNSLTPQSSSPSKGGSLTQTDVNSLTCSSSR